MNEVYALLTQTEAAADTVRTEIENLKIVASLLPGNSEFKDTLGLLREREKDIARVQHEIECLKIVASLLKEEVAIDEAREMPAEAAEEQSRDRHRISEATGTDNMFSSVVSKPRSRFWKLLKRDT